MVSVYEFIVLALYFGMFFAGVVGIQQLEQRRIQTLQLEDKGEEFATVEHEEPSSEEELEAISQKEGEESSAQELSQSENSEQEESTLRHRSTIEQVD